nr:HopJ type III effector protein [Paraglaciecola sp. MB-3u-78]
MQFFYFAQLNELTELETLSLFGSYYPNDMLAQTTATAVLPKPSNTFPLVINKSMFG